MKQNTGMAKLSGKRIGFLAAGIVSLMFVGILYGWSVFIHPLKESFGWDPGQITVAYTVAMILFGVGCMLDGMISNKIGSRKAVFMWIVIYAAGYIGTSLTGKISLSNQANLIWMWIFFGVFAGLGTGGVYSEWLAHRMIWFADRKGFASGLLLVGMGLGGVVISTAANWCFTRGISWNALLMAASVTGSLVLAVSSFIFIRPAPEKVEVEDTVVISSGHEKSLTGMIATAIFWIFVIWKIIISGCAASFIGQAANMASEAGAVLGLATLCVSIMSIGNSLGRILYGILLDKLGRNRMFIIESAAGLAVAAGLLCSVKMQITAMLPAVFFLLGLEYGGGNVLIPNFIQDVFGMKNFKENNGFNNVTTSVGGMLPNLAIGFLTAATGSYALFLIIATVCSLVSLLLAMCFPKMERSICSR